jgi:hypothetical protein
MQRKLNMFLAVATSGSIAAWAVWSKFPLLWAGIIAVSQVISVIKPYLPYERRINEINKLNIQLTSLYNEIEAKWYYFANGLLSDEEMNNVYYEYNKRWIENETQYFSNDSLPVNESFIETANELCELYFEEYF